MNTQDILHVLTQALTKKNIRRKFQHPATIQWGKNTLEENGLSDVAGGVYNADGLLLVEQIETEHLDVQAIKLLLQEVRAQETLERLKTRNLSSTDPEKLERILNARKEAAQGLNDDFSALTGTSSELTPELAPEDKYLMCQTDELYFLEGLTIQDPISPGGTLPFRLWPTQKEVLAALYEDKQVFVILKARQIGISQFFLAHFVYTALFNDNINIILLSKTGEDAKDLIRRAKFLLNSVEYSERLGDITEYLPSLENNNTQSIKLSNGSSILALNATEDAGRSRTANIVFLDEADFLDKPVETFNSLKPLVDAGGQLICVSTGNGITNLMAKLWKMVSERMFKTFLSWRSRPDRDDTWYEEKLSQATDIELFKQEYPNTPEEAFISSSTARFPLLWLQQQAVYSVPFNVVENPFSHIPYGLTVWHKPLTGRKYTIGVDSSEGLSNSDYAVISVWENSSKVQVAEYRAKVAYDILANILATLAEYYNNALCVIERNSYGASTLREAQKLGCYIYAQNNQPGFFTTEQRKVEMIDTYARLLKHNQCVISSKALFDETVAFIRTDRGKLQGGPGSHDDTVIAAALALHVMEQDTGVFVLKESPYEQL